MTALRERWRLLVLAAVFGVQLFAVAYARTADTRYLAWAPYDQISFYEIEIEIDGEALTPEQILRRYELRLWIEDDVVRGRENRAIEHVRTYVRRAEADTDDVVVTVISSTNGGSEEVWTWSP